MLSIMQKIYHYCITAQVLDQAKMFKTYLLI